MKVRYRHIQEPETVKVYDSVKAYKNNPQIEASGISQEEFDKADKERFERDFEKGIVLAYQVMEATGK